MIPLNQHAKYSTTVKKKYMLKMFDNSFFILLFIHLFLINH